MFVRKAALGSPDVIAETYKLTPTELRVLHAIVEVGGVPETAEALGVAETTSKRICTVCSIRLALAVKPTSSR